MAVDEVHKERMKTIASFYNSLSGTFISAGIIAPTIAFLLRPVAPDGALPPLPAVPLAAVVVGCAIGAVLFQVASYIQMGTMLREQPSRDKAGSSKTEPKERPMDSTLYVMAAIPVVAGLAALMAAMLTKRQQDRRLIR